MNNQQIIRYRENFINKIKRRIYKTPLRQNKELYKTLKQQYGEKRKIMGIFSIKRFGRNQMDKITELELSGIRSLEGLEELKNLRTLTCTVEGDIDIESYSKIFGTEEGEKTLNISSTRDLEGMELSDSVKIYDCDMSGRYRKNEIIKINKLLNEVRGFIKPGMSDEKKAEIIYRFLGTYISYDDEAQENKTNIIRSRSLAGCLIDGFGVCAGLAKAMEMVLKDNGIEAKACGGYGDGNEHDFQEEPGNHQWLQVKIDNEWYWCDLTWDMCNEDEFFRGNWKYFLKSDEAFFKDHCADPNDFPEKCTSKRFDEKRKWTGSVGMKAINIFIKKKNQKDVAKIVYEHRMKKNVDSAESEFIFEEEK